MNTSKIEESIKSDYPQFRNSIFKVNHRGWSNLVFEVDDKYIIRIPRNERSSSDLKFEKEMLPLITAKVNVEVPSFIITSSPDSEYEYVGYKRITGIPLTREILRNQSVESLEKLAGQIGQFLSGLHSVKVPRISVHENLNEKWWRLKNQLLSEAKGFFNDSQVEQIDSFFKTFEELLNNSKITPRLIHSDFTEDHILCDFSNQNLTGIIDFGDLEFNDYAFDFAGLYSSYGKKFMLSVMRHYEHEIDCNCINRIENFYLKQVVIHELLHAISMNETGRIQIALDSITKLV